jgi:uncharacterized cupin superfamily protein
MALEFLGVLVTELTGPDAPVVVAEAVLPHGASPPMHVHDDLDDSFYILDGTMVVRCGESVTLESAGGWVQFPKRVPHTFRVMSETARVLMVNADRSFIDVVAAGADPPVTNVGPPMEEDEALALQAELAGA